MIFRVFMWLDGCAKNMRIFSFSTFQHWTRTYVILSQKHFFYFLLPLRAEQRPLWKQQRKALPTLFWNFSFLTLLVFLMQRKGNKDWTPYLTPSASKSKVWLELGFLRTVTWHSHCLSIVIVCKRFFPGSVSLTLNVDDLRRWAICEE